MKYFEEKKAKETETVLHVKGECCKDHVCVYKTVSSYFLVFPYSHR